MKAIFDVDATDRVLVSLARFSIDGTPQVERRETSNARAFREMMGFDDVVTRAERIRKRSVDAFEHEAKGATSFRPEELSLDTETGAERTAATSTRRHQADR